MGSDPSAAMLASALAPGGPDAERIAALWWVMLAVAAAIYVIVLLLGARALTAAGRRPPGAGTRSGAWIAAGTAGVSTAIVGALAWFTLLSLDAMAPRPAAFTIEVLSHLWWWEVRYPDHGVVTANEIHVPVGRPVRLVLTSPDVIHSLWVPSLHGKMDHVPGRVNTLTIEASRTGRYRGQCAEYCGLHHARMAFSVVAEPPEAFEAWIGQQRTPARPPSSPREEEGAGVFLQFCAACHTVRGTDARGQGGPDLTHVAARDTLAGGLLANSPEHLARWIADPQALKPWNRMPTLPLPADALAAVTAYVGSLR